ncbi:MAG: catalase [Lysobacteraceae bacterium]|nr:MAG: catalase [Xanthomonadaceae bacterium]
MVRNLVSSAMLAIALLPVTSCVHAPATTEVDMSKPRTAQPAIDHLLGESLHPDEVAATDAIAAAIDAQIRRRYAPGSARRDAHPKAHGCVRAELRVLDKLPPALAKGIFVPGKHYSAWMRFSNGDSDPDRSDAKPDARGLALKVMGVPGKKLLADEADAGTQDFIFINHPVFFANDPDRYLDLVKAASGEGLLGKLGIPLALGLRGSMIAYLTTRNPMSNPLHGQYFTMVPYALGTGPKRQAVKYSIRPCVAKPVRMPGNPGPGFLRAAMRRTLKSGDFCMELLVQPRTSDDMSVEDSMTEWDAEQAPFIPVATIHIPKQAFDTKARHVFCENLSFTPWHSLPEHRPLGVTNRIRRVVYERISRLRHEMNDTPRVEPQ